VSGWAWLGVGVAVVVAGGVAACMLSGGSGSPKQGAPAPVTVPPAVRPTVEQAAGAGEGGALAALEQAIEDYVPGVKLGGWIGG
jgi:hypothetical protein